LPTLSDGEGIKILSLLSTVSDVLGIRNFRIRQPAQSVHSVFGISALRSFQCFDSVKRASGIKSCSNYSQQFFLGTQPHLQ